MPAGMPYHKGEAAMSKRELIARENKMVPLIKKYKSLTKVVQMFNRI